MTGTDVIDRVRLIVNDPNDTRWTDANMIVFINDGVRLITDILPETLLTAPYTLGTLTAITLVGDTISISDRYRESLVDYVCSRCFEMEGQNRKDQRRAREHYQQFLVKSGLPLNQVTRGRSQANTGG